jgi:DNA mismatch repair protein MSH6
MQRGTSTFDGTAIAFSVAQHLLNISGTGCRSMFATHFHSLIEDFKDHKRVDQGHMSCAVDNPMHFAGENDTKPADVTFLYKLADGACANSFGVSVAKLAKVPDAVVQRAHEKSREFRQNVERGILGILFLPTSHVDPLF